MLLFVRLGLVVFADITTCTDCSHVQLRMIDMLMEGGYTPEEIVEMVTDVEKMAKSIDYPGPLMMLSTVHKAKVNGMRSENLLEMFNC